MRCEASKLIAALEHDTFIVVDCRAETAVRQDAKQYELFIDFDAPLRSP